MLIPKEIWNVSYSKECPLLVTTFPIFLAKDGFLDERILHFLMQFINGFIFWYVYKNGSAAKKGHKSSPETNNNRGNICRIKRMDITSQWGISKLLLTSFTCGRALAGWKITLSYLLVVFLSTLDSILSIAFGSSLPCFSSS